MSNVRAQNRVGTTFEVVFPEFPTFKKLPQWVRLTQEQNKQDVIEISYASFDKHFQKALKTGVTIKLTWRTAVAKGEWVGYVYNGDETTQASLKRNVIIRGIGGSFPLKEGGNKIWKNRTAPEIVQEICKQHKLKAVVDKSTVRFGMQSLVGLTQWEKIQELAERIGFHAYVNNTTLYFQRIDKIIDQFSSVIPIMSHQDAGVNYGSIFEAHTLDQFISKTGDVHETGAHSKREKTVHGIDPITGKSHSYTADPSKLGRSLRESVAEPLFKEVVTTVVADTKGVAKELAEGMAQLSRFSMRASGKGQGDPRISPYKTIEVVGTGVNTDGFWVVNRVEHYMTYDGRYTVEFKCMTDGIGKVKGGKFRVSKATVVPTRDVAYEMATGGAQAPSTPTLRSRQPMVKQTNGGYRVTPTRWVGK